MKPRDVLTWKFAVLRGLSCRRFWPAGPAALRRDPGRPGPAGRRALAPEAAGARRGPGARPGRRFGPTGPSDALRPALAANALRFLARDYPLDAPADAEVLARFDVEGFEALARRAGARPGGDPGGQPPGGHIAALHWLYRRGVPLRLLVQRPRHVSRELNRRFDRDEPAPAVGLLPPPRPLPGSVRSSGSSAPGGAARRPGGLPQRRHPLARPEHPPRPPARPAADVPVGLGRPGRPDPRPGLPRLLHPPPRRPVRADDRPARHA